MPRCLRWCPAVCLECRGDEAGVHGGAWQAVCAVQDGMGEGEAPQSSLCGPLLPKQVGLGKRPSQSFPGLLHMGKGGLSRSLGGEPEERVPRSLASTSWCLHLSKKGHLLQPGFWWLWGPVSPGAFPSFMSLLLTLLLSGPGWAPPEILSP
jgi:hypothetical protein